MVEFSYAKISSFFHIVYLDIKYTLCLDTNAMIMFETRRDPKPIAA